MSSQSLYYNASIVFNPDILGSSEDFGSAYVMNSYQVSGPHEHSITVQDGTPLTFTMEPKTAEGFKWKGWSEDPNGGRLITQNPYYDAIEGADITLYPVFEPNNPSFHRPISVSVNGVSGHDANGCVTVTSMLGYYKYYLSSPMSYAFNQNIYSEYLLPDGKDITVYARKITGYNVAFYVNGNQFSAATIDNGGDDPSQHTAQQTYTRGGEDTRSGEISKNWETITVPNGGSSTGQLTINVVYTEDIEEYTVSVNASPSDGGSVSIGDGTSLTARSYTAPAGTTVGIKAVPRSGYVFLHWKSSEGIMLNHETENITITQDDTWTAYFEANDPSISVRTEGPTGCGTAYIEATGVFGSPTIVHKSDVTGNSVKLHAIANQNHTFQYWYEVGQDERTISEPDITVEFGTGDKVYVAVFAYTPPQSCTYKGYTSVIENGTEHLMSGPAAIQFKAKYLDGDTGNLTETTIGSAVTDINVLSQSDELNTYTSVQIVADQTIDYEHNSHRYRYTLNSLKFANGYVADPSSHAAWSAITLDENGNWVYNIQTESVTDNKLTFSAFYDMQELFYVHTSMRTSTGTYTGNEITVTGGGNDLVAGQSVTVDTATTNSTKYEFAGWYDSSDMETVVSQNTTYTFTVDSNRNLVAKWNTKCKVDYSAVPSAGGSVSCSGVASGGYVDYGTVLTFTCAPNSGYTILNWKNGNTVIASGVNEIDRTITGDSNIKANLMQSSKTLTVRTGGGSVSVYTKASGSANYSLIGTVTSGEENFRIPSNYGFKVEAEPYSRYRFTGIKVYRGGDLIDETSSNAYSMDSVSADTTVVAEFSFIQWITTLGNIIKVY